MTKKNKMCTHKMKCIFYALCLSIIGCFSSYAQDFRQVTSQTFDGIFFGDCAVMDINGDDYPDLIYSGAIVGYEVGNTSVYVNEAGQFVPLEDEFSLIMYSAIAVGDLNGDGLMDFAITGIRKEPGIPDNTKVFEIYYNMGNNTFRKRDDTGIEAVSWGSVHIADLNGDGRMDIFVNGQGSSVYVSKLYFQQEDGSFVASNNTFMGTYFSASAIFDANGDGLDDILITGFSTNYRPETKLYLNKDDGVFVEHEGSGIDGIYFSSISVADFEGDGDLDLLISGMDSTFAPSLKLYLNDGAGNYTPSSFEFQGTVAGACALVDYNNDGFLDVFAFGGTASEGNKTFFYENQNNEAFVLHEENSAVVPGLYNARAVWFDYDNDGDKDLFVTGFDNGVTRAILFENTYDPDGYCPVTADYGVEPITFVKMADLENRTDARIGGSPGYENFTAMEANVQIGQTYTLHVQGNTNIPPPTQEAMVNDIRVFIDWNKDGQFDPATEYYAASLSPSTGEDDVEVTFQIRIPDDAVVGKTRMRIIKDMWTGYEEGEDEDACNNAYYGQVEDYTLHLTSEPVQPACNNEEPGENPGDTGCITFVYNGQQVTYTTVRTADGSIWLQQNLGSEQVATAATDALAYGDLFQWGRWDDGHQNRTSPVFRGGVSPNNPSGVAQSNGGFIVSSPQWWSAGNTTDTWEAASPEAISATNGCDPCKALGEDWSTPTSVEWADIIAAESITNIQTAFDSNLRLTVAGARGTDGVYSDGVRGYYWSKSTSENSTDYAKYLYYSNITMNPNAGGWRQQGSSVRCIKSAKNVNPGGDYCEPEVGNGSYTVPIFEFTFDETTQTSSDLIDQAPVYENFTTVIVEAQQGQTYTVAVKGKTQEQDNFLVKAYIDFNHDFQFSEAESIELGFLQNVGNGIGELTATIAVPADALIGQTRMRIVSMYHNPTSSLGVLENVPCPVGYYLGQVEDYTLNITTGIPVTGVEVTTANSIPAEITAENGTLQLVAQVLPAGTNQAVTWSMTEGETLGSIDQNGVLTAIGNGEVKVRATAVQDGTTYGEITVTINIEALRCPPITLSIDQIGEEQATLTLASNATAFEIEYGPAGFERGSGTSIDLVGYNQLFEGLTAETTYDVYVRVSGCDTWEKITFETIKLKEQIITAADVSKVYGDAPFSVGETTSNLPLTYAVSDAAVAVVENGLLVIKGAGETEVVISQEGNEEYLPATAVRFNLQVAKAPLTVIATDQTKVYDAAVHTRWEVSYTGLVYGETAAVLTGEPHYAGAALEATQVGTYPIEISGYESHNYEIQYQAGTLEIAKARLNNLVFDSGSFIYDGTPKSIYITQNLPEGVTVTYEGNEQVEVGSYLVKASVSGGVNYEDRELEARLIIRHQLSGLTFENQTFVYDGTEHTLAISGELPEGVTVTYTNNGKINAGVYQVIATIVGGERYGNLELTANLTITKATLVGILFEDRTFVYDGTPKSIYVSGTIPQGVTVEHINNGKTAVGRYEVEAKIQGGTNYVSQQLKALLTIEKAPQVITLDEIQTLILSETDDFQLQARSTSTLPLQYTYEYTGSKPAAEVSESGWVTLKKVGEITITVSQAGDANHHAATAVRLVLRIVNNDATIHELWIGEEYYDKPQKEIYHLISCDDSSETVQINVVVDEGAQVQPSNQFVIAVPKPGIYKQTITITSQNGKVIEHYTLIVEKAFAFKDIAVNKFNNSLLINNNPQTNGGYHFSGFQWFKNGTLVSEEQVYSVGKTGLLDYNDVYHAIVTTKDGENIHVCPMEEVNGQNKEIQLYPNPVVLGQKVTLVVKGINTNLAGIPVKIYSLGGQLLHSVAMEGELTEISLPQNLPSGMYVAVFELNGQKESIKFVVKK